MVCLFLSIDQSQRVAEALPELRDLLSELIAQEERMPIEGEPELVIYYGKYPQGGWKSEEVYDKPYADRLVVAMQTAHREAVTQAIVKRKKSA